MPDTKTRTLAKNTKPVLLRRGPFSDRVYAITKYRITKGAVVAIEKHDVTDDFNALASIALQEKDTDS